MGDPHCDPQTSPQHTDPHGIGAFLKKAIQEIHVDRRVVGWSGSPCGSPMWGEISHWPARKVTELTGGLSQGCPDFQKVYVFWGAANGGLRDGGLRKSEDI